MAPVAQWIECLPPEQKVVGSNPIRGAESHAVRSLNGYGVVSQNFHPRTNQFECTLGETLGLWGDS